MDSKQTYEIRIGQKPDPATELYREKPPNELRSFVKAIPYGIAGFVLASVIRWVTFWLGPVDGINSWMAGLVGITAAIALGVLLSLARNRNSLALAAITKLVAGNQTVIGFIEALDDDESRERCRWAYTNVVRSIFCLAAGRQFTAVGFDGKALGQSFATIRQWFHMELKQAGLDQVLLGGNSRMNAVLEARSAINTLTNIRIPRGTYLSVGVLFGLTCISSAVFMASLESSWWFGVCLVGAFVYGVAMMMITARNLSYPYGRGHEMIELNARFAFIETENRRAARAADMHREQENPMTE